MFSLTTDLKSVIPILKKLFGPRKTKIFNYVMNPKKKPIPGREGHNKRRRIANKYPNLIRISVYAHFISIDFNKSLIPWMNKKLKTTMPTIEMALPGIRIIYPPFYQIDKRSSKKKLKKKNKFLIYYIKT